MARPFIQSDSLAEIIQAANTTHVGLQGLENSLDENEIADLEELIVVDRSGRLYISLEHVHQLNTNQHANIEILDDGTIVIRPNSDYLSRHVDGASPSNSNALHANNGKNAITGVAVVDVEPSTESETERLLSETLAQILKVDQVSADSHFFEELGADSMVMARFCARLRKQTDLPPVSIKEVYEHPSVRKLAATIVGEKTTEFPPPAFENAAPQTETERLLSETLAQILKVDQLSADSHFFEELGADSMVMARFCARLRKQTDLPPVSIKEVYEHSTVRKLAATIVGEETTQLPAPATENMAPESETERILSETLAQILKVDQVSVDSHFFEELGADSMVMARFCARLRKQTDLPPVSIKEVYEQPSVRKLAAAFINADRKSESPPAPTPKVSRKSARLAAPIATEETATLKATETMPIGVQRYYLCGTLQFATIFAYLTIITFITEASYEWSAGGASFIEIFLRSLLSGNALFFVTCFLPILAKWTLIGRWQPQQIRVWSLAYYRFWVVKTLVRLNPLVLFAGTPIYVLYLRALGAKIGRNVLILSNQVPVCTDLLTVGDNSILRKDTLFNCYRAYDGLIQTGAVTIGSDAYVGELSVLDIDTKLGDGAQLSHASSLKAGQSIPDGEHRSGASAQQRTEVDHRGVSSHDVGPLRKIIFTAAQLLNTVVIAALLFSIVVSLTFYISELPYFATFEMPLSRWVFLGDAVLITIVLFLGSLLLGLLAVLTLPRLLNRALEPDRTYPLYGFHYWIHRTIDRYTNVKFFIRLFGDSSYVVYYLRWLGYTLSEPLVQTGSNFGSAVKHNNPFLVSVGSGTMVADGLSCINAQYSSTSFRVSRVTIGANNFLGNRIAYPAQGKTGENCLLATKVLVPVEGDVREGVGLLGSPSFEIPRTVQRDLDLDHPESDEELASQLAAKNKHNLVTMGLFLLVQWFFFFVTVLFVYISAILYPTFGAITFTVALLFRLFFGIFYYILVERAATLFRTLQPQQCSIYNPYFWFHERHWKLSTVTEQLRLFDGTPMKTFAWRLLGVQIGKNVLDDGCAMTEKTMVTVGDNCTLNAGCVLQCHSQEDGGFKSDRITIGAGCTLGVGAFIHYGTKIGDGAQIAADTFLMKGAEVPPQTQWAENPAVEVDDVPMQEAVLPIVVETTSNAIQNGPEPLFATNPRLLHHFVNAGRHVKHLDYPSIVPVNVATTTYLNDDDRSTDVKLLTPLSLADHHAPYYFESTGNESTPPNHPNFARIYKAGQSADRKFIVMELIEDNGTSGKRKWPRLSAVPLIFLLFWGAIVGVAFLDGGWGRIVAQPAETASVQSTNSLSLAPTADASSGSQSSGILEMQTALQAVDLLSEHESTKNAEPIASSPEDNAHQDESDTITNVEDPLNISTSEMKIEVPFVDALLALATADRQIALPPLSAVLTATNTSSTTALMVEAQSSIDSLAPPSIPLQTQSALFPRGSFEIIKPDRVAVGSGPTQFKWKTPVELAPGQAFEVVFWKADQDLVSQSVGVAQPTKANQLTADLTLSGSAANELLDPGIYKWTVLLINQSPYQRLQVLGDTREFHIVPE